MKTLRIGIASYEELKKRSMDIASGHLKPSKNDPQVWFPSMESLAKVLSEKNLWLLDSIATREYDSITALAKSAGRAKSNLSRTLKTLENYGLVILKKIKGRIIPVVNYDKITMNLSLNPLQTC